MKKKPDRRSGTRPPPEIERRRKSADRRGSDRIVVDLKVDFRNQDMYLYSYIADLSSMGVFIFTGNPHPVGSRLQLRFSLPDDKGFLEAEGEVRWVRLPNKQGVPEPGMGVLFLKAPGRLLKKLSTLIKRVVYFEAETGGENDE